MSFYCGLLFLVQTDVRSGGLFCVQILSVILVLLDERLQENVCQVSVFLGKLVKRIFRIDGFNLSLSLYLLGIVREVGDF